MWNNAFELQYGHLNDDEVEQVEESINFDEDKPLADLEAMHNFYSLRADIEYKMNGWLDNATVNFANNPDDHPVFDEETRALLTPDCKTIIGGAVVNFCDPYHGSPGPEQMIPLCSIVNGDCCWWGGSKGEALYNNNSKLYIVYVRLKNKIGFDVPSKVKAKVISCKQKSNDKWKRYRTHLRVLAGGQYHTDNSCASNPNIVSKQKPSNGGTIRRKKLRVADNLWFQGIRRALDYEIRGSTFVGSNQQEFLSVPLVF
jgi:hypothetical protein